MRRSPFSTLLLFYFLKFFSTKKDKRQKNAKFMASKRSQNNKMKKLSLTFPSFLSSLCCCWPHIHSIVLTLFFIKTFLCCLFFLFFGHIRISCNIQITIEFYLKKKRAKNKIREERNYLPVKNSLILRDCI